MANILALFNSRHTGCKICCASILFFVIKNDKVPIRICCIKTRLKRRSKRTFKVQAMFTKNKITEKQQFLGMQPQIFHVYDFFKWMSIPMGSWTFERFRCFLDSKFYYTAPFGGVKFGARCALIANPRFFHGWFQIRTFGKTDRWNCSKKMEILRCLPLLISGVIRPKLSKAATPQFALRVWKRNESKIEAFAKKDADQVEVEKSK